MAEGMLALTWNNHSSTFCKTISSLKVKERYTDVTLTCEGKFYQVHKFVLATCSEYFEKIFEETPCKHPVIVLRDVSCDELEALLNYMYIGSVSVAQNDLSRLIKVAELFQIKGLAVPDDPPSRSSDSDSNIISDGRDKTDSCYRESSQESRRTSPYSKNKNTRSVEDDYNSPHPKRVRGHDNSSMSEQGGPYNRGTGIRKSNDIQSDASSNDQPVSFVHVKEEIHDITDSESESLDSRVEAASFIPKSEDQELSHDDQVFIQEDSQLAPSYVPSTESQDVPPDGQSLNQPVMGQHSFGDDILSLPGPSDAQEWYSEGDASGGLPVGKGSVENRNQEMLPMDASQQQPQRMMDHLSAHLKTSVYVGEKFKIYSCAPCSFSTNKQTDFEQHISAHTAVEGGQFPCTAVEVRQFPCPHCPSSFSQRGNLKIHMRRHTGERPFPCPKCYYRSSLKQTLQRHMIRKHNDYSMS